MAIKNGAGLLETTVFAPNVADKEYPYRTGLGMASSQEAVYYFDDFTQAVATNVPTGWTAAIIDTGGTITTNVTAALGAGGVLTVGDATASEGAAAYGSKSVQLTAGKKFFIEARLRTDDVTDNTIQFGITDLTAVTNPEDLWTTAAANLATFGITDGSANLAMLADKANSGTSAQTSTTPLVADTWTILAIAYDGANLQGYKDGKLVMTWSSASTTIPTGTALAPFFGMINGNGAGGNLVLFDYIRYSVER